MGHNIDSYTLKREPEPFHDGSERFKMKMPQGDDWFLSWSLDREDVELLRRLCDEVLR